MDHFIKSPCPKCPFRNDITPFLHPERAAEIVYASHNPYTDFPCHKTVKYTGEEDDENDYDSEPVADLSRSKTCAGFLTLRAQSGQQVPEGFEPSWELCYTDESEMIQSYEEEWENQHK